MYAARSDAMVATLEANQGLVIGKTNTPEFGAGASTFNEVLGFSHNPCAKPLLKALEKPR